MLSGLRAFWRKHFRQRLKDYELPAIIVCMVVFIFLGYIVIKNYNLSIGEDASPAGVIYQVLLLFTMGTNVVSGTASLEMEVVRLLAPIFPFYVIVRILATTFQSQAQSAKLRYLIRDHVILCGINPAGLTMARGFYENGFHIVVIDGGASKDMLDKCKDMDAIVIPGRCGSIEALRKARVDKARYVLAVTDDNGANAEAAIRVKEAVADSRSKTLTCYAVVTDPGLWGLLKSYGLKMGAQDRFRLELINPYHSGAKALLSRYPAFDGVPSLPAMAIIGDGRMSESLLVEAARGFYFKRKGEKLPVLLISRDAAEKLKSLTLRYPRLADTCTIDAVSIDPSSGRETGEYLSRTAKAHSSVNAYVCADTDASALMISLPLLPFIPENVSLTMCVEKEGGIASLVKGQNDETSGRLNVFTLTSGAYDALSGGVNSVLARAIHDDYIIDQKRLGKAPGPSTAIWDELSEELRESNRRSADHIMDKLRAIGCDLIPVNDWGIKPFEFTPDELERLSIMEHDRWVRERQLQGFRYGEKKDIDKKITPYIVSWEKLPDEIKEYDRNVVRGMPAFLAKEGYAIVRKAA